VALSREAQVSEVIAELVSPHAFENRVNGDTSYWEMFWYSSHGMFQSSRAGRFLRVNPAFARTLGYASPQEMIDLIQNMETDLYVDPDVRHEFRQRVEISDSVQGIQFQAWRKDKSKIWLSVHSRAARNEKGQILCYEGTAEDISARKQSERELQDAHRELVRQSRRLALHVKELEQFSNVLAHDLAAPLRMVCSYLPQLEISCHEKLSDREKALLDYATEGAAHAKALLGGLLRYAKTQPPVSPPPLIDSTVCARFAREALADEIAAAGAAIRIDPLPTVRQDRALLSDIFLNLFSNAIKHAGRESIVVNVSAEDLGEEWQFRVGDNGRGVAESDRERIFFLYQRGDNSTYQEGSGIGLATCRRIVTMSGGRIWVEARPTGGADFLFTIPKSSPSSNRIDPEYPA